MARCCCQLLSSRCCRRPTSTLVEIFRRHYAPRRPCSQPGVDPTRLADHPLQGRANGCALSTTAARLGLEAQQLAPTPCCSATRHRTQPRSLAPGDRSRPTRAATRLRPSCHRRTVAWAAWLEKGYALPDGPGSSGRRRARRSRRTAHHGAARDPGQHGHALHRRAGDRRLELQKKKPAWDRRASRSTRPHPPWVAPSPTTPSRPAWLPARARARTEGAQHPWLRLRSWAAGATARRATSAAAPAEGQLLRPDDRGRPPARPALRVARGAGPVGPTLVVFTSDHGEQMGDHWLLGKAGYFDAVLPRPADRAGSAARASDAHPRQRRRRLHRERRRDAHAPRVDRRRGAARSATGARCSRSSPTARAPEGWRREAHFEFDFREQQGGAPERSLGVRLHECALACCATSATSTSTSPRSRRCSSISSATPPSAATAPATRPICPSCSSTRSACSPGAWPTTIRRSPISALTPDGVYERRNARWG